MPQRVSPRRMVDVGMSQQHSFDASADFDQMVDLAIEVFRFRPVVGARIDHIEVLFANHDAVGVGGGRNGGRCQAAPA